MYTIEYFWETNNIKLIDLFSNAYMPPEFIRDTNTKKNISV